MFYISKYSEKEGKVVITDSDTNKSANLSVNALQKMLELFEDEDIIIYGVFYYCGEIYKIVSASSIREAVTNYYRMFIFDKVYDIYEGVDYTEVTGSIGGDACRYRIYNNGKVGMK